MLLSNERKQALCGWLMKNNYEEYLSSLKLQKFLFFYEMFCKINNEKADLYDLKGYRNGPIFSGVWQDYTKNKAIFNQKSKDEYESNKNQIKTSFAKESAFLVKILNEQELSDLTHQLNIWSSKEDRIKNGEKNVPLSENDLNTQDIELLHKIENMYPISLIDNSYIEKIGSYSFLFKKEDVNKLDENHIDILNDLIKDGAELHNPIYVEIDKDGSLLID